MTARAAKKEDSSAFLLTISVGAFAGLLLFLSDGVSHVTPLIGAGVFTQYFFMSAFCAGVCCGFFFAIRGALSAADTYRYFGIKAGCLAVFGFAACLLASHLRLPAGVFIPCGALFGLGIGMLGIAKGVQLNGLGTRQFLFIGLLASLLAGTLKILLLLLPPVWLGGCVILLLIVSAIMPLTLCPPGITAKAKNRNAAGLVKGMVERNWVFFCSLLLCLLVNTLPWAVAFSKEAINPLWLTARIGTGVGSIIASLLLLLLIRDRLIDRLPEAMPIVPLICTALLMLAWYVFIWDGGINLLGGYSTPEGQFAASLPVGFATILALFILLWRLRMEMRLGLSPDFVYGIFITFIAGLFLVFIVLQYTLVQAVLTGIDQLLRIVFLVVTGIYLMKSTRGSTPMAVTLPPDQRMHEVSLRYGLSKREMDILALLMERRSAPYIAEVEFIALSTVKTHINHLYLKTGAHNRKELLDIVFREDDE
jgi:DNA-binding CsgD family transcriptional regulator